LCNKKTVNIGFDPKRIDILVKDICPVKAIPKSIKRSRKYKQIALSVEDIGLVEPLPVSWSATMGRS